MIFFILFANTVFFALLICLVTLLALTEFYGMGLADEPVSERWVAVAGGTILVLVLSFASPPLRMAGVTCLFLLYTIFYLFTYRDLQKVVQRLAIVILGFLYLPLLLSYIPLLRSLPFGREWIFAVLLLVMMGDSAAYFVGVRFGKRQLYPAISPKKSVEGAIGGLAGNLIGIFVAKFWFFPALQTIDCLSLGVLIGALAQLGDLFESMLKRSFGVKDSGKMIPGHGGLLDRLDSLLFAFAPVYFYALLFFQN